MAMNANDIEKLIKAGIPDAQVTIRDLAGDGDHYAAEELSRQKPGAAAPDGLQCAAGQHGRRSARPGVADQRARVSLAGTETHKRLIGRDNSRLFPALKMASR